MKLAKYMGQKYGIKSVVEGSFKLSKASEFNDPFDCDGRLTEAAPPVFLEPAEVKQLRSIGGQPYLDAHVQWACRFRDELQSKKLIDRYYRITCFREYTGEDDDTDRLFWSHYADNGNGIRVIFDFEDTDFAGKLKKVEYWENCPVCDLGKVRESVEDPELVDFMDKRIFTKGLQWKSEAEVRLCVPLNGEGWKPYGSDGMVFLPIDYKKLVGVDFGVNVPEESAKSSVEICRKISSLAHVQFRKAEKSRDAYSYDYVVLT